MPEVGEIRLAPYLAAIDKCTPFVVKGRVPSCGPFARMRHGPQKSRSRSLDQLMFPNRLFSGPYEELTKPCHTPVFAHPW